MKKHRDNKPECGVESDLVWWCTSQNAHHNVHIFDQLLFCFVHSLLVWRERFCAPGVRISPLDFTYDKVEDVSSHKSQDNSQVNFTITTRKSQT